MSISVTLNPGNRQFYNNVWYVGGQNVIVDNATAATWIIANIADVSPNQPTGLVENFPSQAAFNASLTAGVAAVGISKEGLQFNNGLKTRSIVDALRVSIVSGINRFKSKNPYENGQIGRASCRERVSSPV